MSASSRTFRAGGARPAAARRETRAALGTRAGVRRAHAPRRVAAHAPGSAAARSYWARLRGLLLARPPAFRTNNRVRTGTAQVATQAAREAADAPPGQPLLATARPRCCVVVFAFRLHTSKCATGCHCTTTTTPRAITLLQPPVAAPAASVHAPAAAHASAMTLAHPASRRRTAGRSETGPRASVWMRDVRPNVNVPAAQSRRGMRTS
jgi:hypothetical protein